MGQPTTTIWDFFSIELLAVAVADGLFSIICARDYGRNSDDGVLRNSPFGNLFHMNKLNILPAYPLSNETELFPMYFVGDEAFPLSENILRPYPGRDLNNKRRIFNDRLERARKTVECAFLRLASKFRVFYSRISCEPTKIEVILKSACVLHNFIYKNEKFRVYPNEDNSVSFGKKLKVQNKRPTNTARANRDKLADFFMKPENAVPWQNYYCVKS